MTTTHEGDEYVPETVLTTLRRPQVGESFVYGSNNTITIEQVTDDFMFLSNGIKLRWKLKS